MLQYYDDVARRGLVRREVVEVDGRGQFSIYVTSAGILRAVLFLVAANGLVLLSSAHRVVVCMYPRGGAVLYLTVRNLYVSVVLFFVVLLRPTILLRLPRILYNTLVGAEVVL